MSTLFFSKRARFAGWLESAFSFSLSGLEREERRIGTGARETVVDATPPSATERNTTLSLKRRSRKNNSAI